MGTQKRKTYIDVLRIMGTLMIMFNHTSTFGFALYTVRTQGILYWLYLFLAILVKVAVPIFFMISGGLLLEREGFYGVDKAFYPVFTGVVYRFSDSLFLFFKLADKYAVY